MVLVKDAEMAEAIFLMLERMKTVVEPAGAASIAACLAGLVKAPRGPSAAIISGGNVDMYILDQIVAKGLEREHRLLRVKVSLSDKPGALKDVLDVVARSRANVIDVELERIGEGVPIGRAEVVLSLETQNFDHTKALVRALGHARLKYRLLD
jgi:threonine dehydratase